MQIRTHSQTKKLALFLIMLASAFLFNTTAQAASAHSKPDSLAPMLKKVMPAVVNIRSEGQLPPVIYLQKESNKKFLSKSKSENINNSADKNNDGGLGLGLDQDPNQDNNQQQYQQQPSSPGPFMAQGSGVIVSAKQGYIVTNAHVIKDADRVTVTLKDGRHFKANVIGTDEPSDLAILQIPANKLTQIEFANPNSVEVGDKAIAIGNPFGLDQSVTSGIVSALERSNLQIESFENFIQIDAPINPGNSGGALVNGSGELIGINTAIISPGKDIGSVGIGFAIPISMVHNVAKQLIQYGKVERGIVGVMVQTLSPALAESLDLTSTDGAIVTSVSPNSPVEKAGIKVGDIITKVDDTDIHSSSQIINTVGFVRTGTKVTLNILRNGKIIKLTPTIIDAKKQKEVDQRANPYLYGLALQNFDQYNPAQGNLHGVLVIAVSPDSNAWSSEIHPGDIILEANGKPVKDTLALEKIAKKTTDNLMLRIIRQNGFAYVVIPKLVQTEENTADKKEAK